jgi:parvulin-like peptidyl-prolyl isomerase
MFMKRTIFLLIFISLIAVLGFSQANLQTAAVVNLIRSEPIAVGQLRTEVERREKEAGRTMTLEGRRQVLDEMINERLILQAAERDRILVTENEITQSLRNNLAQQIGRLPTDAEFAQAVRESGMTEQALREQARKQVVAEKYLMAKKGSLIESIRAPTEEEIAVQFSLVRTQFVRPETVEFSGIQIPYGPDAASRTKARELADRLNREIGSDPSKFDTAFERAVMPNSGYNAGRMELPRIPEAQREFGQDFINTAFSLRQGQVSRLIETPNHYYIIKVTRNLEYKILELNDNIPGYLLPAYGIDPRMTVSVRNFLGNFMLLERQQNIILQATQEIITELRTGRSFQIFENNLNW